MAIKTHIELLESIKERFSENTDDETIALIEDISDTLNNYQTITEDSTNWKEKYEENDKEWREKYKARFFNTEKIEEIENKEKKRTYDEDEPAILTYDKLFKEE